MPGIIFQELDDEALLDSLRTAVELKLDEPFIQHLRDAVKQRGLRLDNVLKDCSSYLP